MFYGGIAQRKNILRMLQIFPLSVIIKFTLGHCALREDGQENYAKRAD